MDPRELLVAELADRYAVQHEVGRGGMAIVYLAEDLRHGRRVAIKVLRPEVLPVSGAERFLREIAIAARLTYPHILPLLDSGTAGDLLYYVMPYIEGLSLRARMDEQKQLSLEETVRMGTQVANALDYAHSHGVVHRDIKPENILLSGGQAIVSDFGIARGIWSASGRLTSTGMVLGTPAYMSPEQGTGSDVDGRTDIYALACVLYEALAGQPPFTGATQQMVQARHQFDPVPPLRSIRPALPEALERTLQRALAKAPADRYASAKEFSEALARAAQAARGESPESTIGRESAAQTPAAVRPDTAATTLPLPSAPRARFAPRIRTAAIAVGIVAVAAIAGLLTMRGEQPKSAGPRDWIFVADFEGPANDPELATAARELLTAALDQSGIVVTVPQDRMRQALRRAGRPESARVDPEVAAELAYRAGIRSVVAGRIQRLGEGYSTVVRVVDAESSTVVLTVDETARDSKDLIPSLSRLAQKLRRGLGESRDGLRATRPLTEVTTPSFQAFRHFVRAGQLINRGLSAEGLIQARAAISLDPEFSAAWRALALAHSNTGRPDSAYVAFQRALEHPDRLEEWRRLDVEAQIASLEDDPSRALSAYDRALRLMPQGPALKNNLALLLSELGRIEEAADTLRSALDDDPMGPAQVILSNAAENLLRLDQLDEARLTEGRMEALPRRFYGMARAVTAQDWKTADSVARAFVSDPSTPGFQRMLSALLVGSEQAARGHVQEVMAPAGSASPLIPLIISLITGQPAGKAPTVAEGSRDLPPLRISQAMRSILEKDVAGAERAMAEIRASRGPTFLGLWPEYIEAWIDGESGRWTETVRRLAPGARTGAESVGGWALPPVGPMLMRWTVGYAYEKLDQPDSAAFYYELAISTERTLWMERIRIHALAPYVHRRLAMIYLKTGRLDEAERHGEIYITAMAGGDPELRASAAELRRMLANARAMAPRRI